MQHAGAIPHRRLSTAVAARQLNLNMEATRLLPSADDELTGEHGEVFTRRWVAELILDLVGYTADRDLAAIRAIEPACGSGAFLIPMIERLVESARLHDADLLSAHRAITACDLLQTNVERSRAAAALTLKASGIESTSALDLAEAWVTRRDFLLDPPAEGGADVVVGNPPYIRLEAVPQERSDAYRRACSTMGGRADVYIGFYEHGLLSLTAGGALGFICADRWMRNAYGSRLREMITAGWSVDAVVSMTDVDAFEEEVDAYPAITVIRRARQCGGPLLVDGSREFGETQAREVAGLDRLDQVHVSGAGYRAARLHSWFNGRAGWPTGSPDELAVIADLEAEFPPLEDTATGTRVGIGIATGSDRIFIVRDPSLVEPERLLPLALARDLSSGRVDWSGHYLVNPWDADGLVDLDEWPRLDAYLRSHRIALSRRHTARSGRWHKTIDRVIEGLATQPKLYLPDFKEAIWPVLDRGATYPHHNLYWVTSEDWEPRVLGGLLLSDVANMFIKAYSVRMRGGFLRFQAQYLRRIRLPRCRDLDEAACTALASAFDTRDREAATAAALPLYGLSQLPT